jgi:hypothetical protein
LGDVDATLPILFWRGGPRRPELARAGVIPSPVTHPQARREPPRQRRLTRAEIAQKELKARKVVIIDKGLQSHLMRMKGRC